MSKKLSNAGHANNDRRRDVRVPILRVEARFGTGKDEKVLGLVRDLSKSGAYIDTSLNPATTEFQVTFIIQDTNPPESIRTLVQWVRADATGIGVRFLAIDEDDFKRFCELVASGAIYQRW
jgi:hypothetical protein